MEENNVFHSPFLISECFSNNWFGTSSFLRCPNYCIVTSPSLSDWPRSVTLEKKVSSNWTRGSNFMQPRQPAENYIVCDNILKWSSVWIQQKRQCRWFQEDTMSFWHHPTHEIFWALCHGGFGLLVAFPKSAMRNRIQQKEDFSRKGR